MEGVSIIESGKIKNWELRLENIEQMLLILIKSNKDYQQEKSQGNVPDFISISKASKKYDLSRTTLYNKIKLYSKVKGRDIDRLQTGSICKVNEIELIEAIRIKSEVPVVFSKKKSK